MNLSDLELSSSLSNQSNILIEFNPFEVDNVIDFYSIDGTRNNPTDVSLGAVDTALLTISPTAYTDGASALAGANRPAPRIISNALGQQNSPITSTRQLTNMIWAFGQFLDHDLSLTPIQSREEAIANNDLLRIAIPQGDPFLDPQGSGRVAIEFRRSEFIDGTGDGPNNPRQYTNEITHWLDLSNVYGSDEERAAELRSFSNGQMKISGSDFMPLAGENANDNPGPTPNAELFLAGDVRANENVVLASMHTLFVREHNRIATALQNRHTAWTDDQLYQRARQINIAQWQNIVYNEYLPTLLGKGAMADYDGYDATVDPRISRTFSTAAYRFGHSQLTSEIQRLDADGNVIPDGNLALFDSYFPSANVLTATDLDPVLQGITSSLSQEVDLKLINDVRNMLFNFGNFSAAQDLFALNIQRGRDHGLADYNTIRTSFGLPAVTTFADITADPNVQQQLADLYDTVDDIDAMVGMLAEDHYSGSSVGETISTVLVDQFERLRGGDRLYYENAFTPDEIALIEATRLSDIIERNTEATNVQANVFTLMTTPEAVNDGATTAMNKSVSIDALANDFDPENRRLRITQVDDPSHGRAAIINGEIRYIPNINFVGTDSFEYTIRDVNGNTDKAQIDVAVTGVPVPSGEIRGQVRNDIDRDGSWSDNESGIAGVTIELFRDANVDYIPDGPAIATTLTDSTGNYRFGDLAPGTYVVEQTNLEGYVSTADINGFNLDRIGGIRVNSNTVNGQDFLDAPPFQIGAIRGQVRHDVDGDGDLNDADVGIPNITLRLFEDANRDFRPDGAAIATTTTDANGNYVFENLANGSFVVGQTNLEGYASTADANGFNPDRISGIRVKNRTVVGQDFLDTATDEGFSISGQVRYDADGDGDLKDDDLGISEVTITLFQDENFDYRSDGAAIATTTTDANGNYRFEGLANGGYVVESTNRERFISTADVNGFNPDRIAGIKVNSRNVANQDFLDQFAVPPLHLAGSLGDTLLG